MLYNTYVNPLTDFSLKKLFGNRLDKEFDLVYTQKEISKFTLKEHQRYESNLKAFRDFKNSVDTAIKAGEEQRNLAIAKELTI